MVEIDGKTYELIELSGRKYQALVDRFDKEYGENWQNKGGLKIGCALLSACLKSEDGGQPTEDQIIDLPIRKINQLSSEAMVLNGMSPESGKTTEKN